MGKHRQFKHFRSLILDSSLWQALQRGFGCGVVVSVQVPCSQLGLEGTGLKPWWNLCQKGAKLGFPIPGRPKHYHCSALCPRCGAVLGKSSSSSSSPFWGRGTSGCQCCWSGCARRGSGSPCSVLSLQKQTNTRGEGTFQKHLLLVLLAYHKSKHNIFSFLGINVWQYNWRPAPGAYCLELTKEIESLVSNCKYPPIIEFVCSAVRSGVTGCGTPWHQVSGGKDPLLR